MHIQLWQNELLVWSINIPKIVIGSDFPSFSLFTYLFIFASAGLLPAVVTYINVEDYTDSLECKILSALLSVI